MPKALQDSLAIIKEAKVQLNKIIGETEYRANLLELNSLFQRIEARLVFIGAVDNSKAVQSDNKLQPMTRFMGKEIKQDKTPSQRLDPQEHAIQLYRKKVNKLYEQIGGMHVSNILNSYTMEDDVMVLRGVAKKAGVTDYETKELNEAFVEEIQAGIAAKNEESALQKSIDDKHKNKGTEVTVTQDMIDSSKFLQKEKVKPGDKVLQLQDGKYKLLKHEAV